MEMSKNKFIKKINELIEYESEEITIGTNENEYTIDCLENPMEGYRWCCDEILGNKVYCNIDNFAEDIYDIITKKLKEVIWEVY